VVELSLPVLSPGPFSPPVLIPWTPSRPEEGPALISRLGCSVLREVQFTLVAGGQEQCSSSSASVHTQDEAFATGFDSGRRGCSLWRWSLSFRPARSAQLLILADALLQPSSCPVSPTARNTPSKKQTWPAVFEE
jgi:hypothetical protein